MKYVEKMLLDFTLLIILQQINPVAYICGLIVMFIGMYFDHKVEKESNKLIKMERLLKESADEQFNELFGEKNDRRNCK